MENKRKEISYAVLFNGSITEELIVTTFEPAQIPGLIQKQLIRRCKNSNGESIWVNFGNINIFRVLE